MDEGGGSMMDAAMASTETNGGAEVDRADDKDATAKQTYANALTGNTQSGTQFVDRLDEEVFVSDSDVRVLRDGSYPIVQFCDGTNKDLTIA
ncbi:hypothetical protein V6N13_098380 [Hibiscus sabdariffa]|uniref:Uncharacterized protein n=1 Tax=Hibiscus sabdariffa TaxID=183260 RepID=A0ABR2EDM1_9ROSI